MATRPSIPGICRSTTTTRGSSRRLSSRAWVPPAAGAVVAHQPTDPVPVPALSGPGSDPMAVTALAADFTTSAVALLDVEGPWAG
ncbi:MAG: hypothetical protein ACYCYA_12100 [Actinomycetes bacterium]